MTNEPPDAEIDDGGLVEAAAVARLHDHVGQIVAIVSAVPAQGQELADELYSGLWERWQSARAEGLPAGEAADQAIAAFGSPGQLGPELALAFHSRLYEATVGVLLPPVSAARQWPLGLGRAATGMVVLGVFAALGGAVGALTLSPTRAIIMAIVSIAAASIWLLAARALVRGQRWSLALGRVGLILWVTSLLPGIRDPGITINLGGLIAVVMAFPLLGPDLSRWVNGSVGIGLRRGLLVTGIATLAVVLGIAPGAIPELTAASSSDVHLQVTMTCEGPQQAPTAIEVTALITWDRREPWPNGLRPKVTPVDWASAWLDGTPAIAAVMATTQGPAHRYFQPNWGFSQGPSDGEGLASPETAIWPQLARPVAINRRLKAQLSWIAQSPIGDPVNSVVVTYEHLGRFGLQAIATCASSGTGTPIDPPFALP